MTEPHDLLKITPSALASMAVDLGWRKAGRYPEGLGVHIADIYTAHAWPELLIPVSNHPVDYASVVQTLIGHLARVAGKSREEMTAQLLDRPVDIAFSVHLDQIRAGTKRQTIRRSTRCDPGDRLMLSRTGKTCGPGLTGSIAGPISRAI